MCLLISLKSFISSHMLYPDIPNIIWFAWLDFHTNLFYVLCNLLFFHSTLHVSFPHVGLCPGSSCTFPYWHLHSVIRICHRAFAKTAELASGNVARDIVWWAEVPLGVQVQMGKSASSFNNSKRLSGVLVGIYTPVELLQSCVSHAQQSLIFPKLFCGYSSKSSRCDVYISLISAIK